MSLICLSFSGCTTVKFIASKHPAPVPRWVEDSPPQLSIETEPQKAKKIRCDFPEGEKLIYKVEWLGIDVAKAVIELEEIVKIENSEAYKIKLVAETNGVIAKIFPLHNEYLSYIDVKNVRSIKNETERHEGRREKKNETVFDWANQKAYYTDILKNRKKVIDIPKDTYDVLGAAYYFRTLDIGVGDTVSLHVFSNGKVYPLYATIKKRGDLTVRDIGNFKTFLIEPYIIRNGKIDKRARVKAYFSADKNRWPIYISLKGPIFTRINIIVQKIEGKV